MSYKSFTSVFDVTTSFIAGKTEAWREEMTHLNTGSSGSQLFQQDSRLHSAMLPFN